MFKPTFRSFTICFLFLFFSTLFSCQVQRIAYFKDIPDTLKLKSMQSQLPAAPIVQPDDVLNITIQTLDPDANTILNQGNLAINSGTIGGSREANQAAIAGYLVDKNGYIHLPYIGDVMAKGLSTSQLRDLIIEKISIYFKSPVVNVRYANFKITVLGEVANPASFLVPNESPTIIDALGLAGDVTIYGRRDNIMLIRTEEGGKKDIARLNLDSSKIIESPFFYLKPNDVVYVEASEDRVQATSAYRTRDVAIISSALSLMIVIVARLIR